MQSDLNIKKITFPRWIFYFFLINKISFRSVWVRKSSWFGTLLFACCLLILFPFGLGTEALQRLDVRIGSLWIINEFIAALVIGRMFSPEQESYALDYLLSSRIPRASLLAGKISFTAIQILSLQVPVTFLWIVLYNVPTNILIELLKTIVPVSLIFNLGTASLGALVSCLTARSLAKEILQPMLFFPLQSGVLLAAVSLSLQIGDNMLLGAFSSTAWWTVLSAYPVLFTALGFLLSNVLLQE